MLRIAIVVYDSCNIISIFYALRFYHSAFTILLVM